VKIDIVRQRLWNQRLASTEFQQPDEVVAWLGAVQSQDFSGAKWGVGLRGGGLTDADLNHAFDAGLILRTHVLRPTWHFVTPSDIRWMLALTAPRVHARNAPYHRRFGLDSRLIARGRRAIERTLEGGRQLTRVELGTALARAGIALDPMRLVFVIMHAELEAVICSGARRDKQFTYALLDERAPRAPILDRDEALAELARRYFTSHGPATVRDYAWWSGLTMRDARAGVELAKKTLANVVVDGLTCWHAPSTAARRGRGARAYLLPNYDEYLVAHQDRGWVVESRPTAARGAAGHPHHLIIDGKLRGSWKRTFGSRAAGVEIRPYRRLNAADASAVAKAVDRYSRFLGMPVTLM
jgi:winged helix DNA-binding protein